MHIYIIADKVNNLSGLRLITLQAMKQYASLTPYIYVFRRIPIIREIPMQK